MWTNAADGSGTMRTGKRTFCLLGEARRAEAAAALCPMEEVSHPTNPTAHSPSLRKKAGICLFPSLFSSSPHFSPFLSPEWK